jgi:hypothetical protein
MVLAYFFRDNTQRYQVIARVSGVFIAVALVLGICAAQADSRPIRGYTFSPASAETVRPLLFKLFGDDPRAYLGFAPEITVLPLEIPNAYAVWPNRIYLTKGLLRLAQSDAARAFVIAHEIAHLQLGHRGLSNTFQGKHDHSQVLSAAMHQELDADRLALTTLRESHVAANDGIALLARLSSLEAAKHSTRRYALRTRAELLVLALHE